MDGYGWMWWMGMDGYGYGTHTIWTMQPTMENLDDGIIALPTNLAEPSRGPLRHQA